MATPVIEGEISGSEVIQSINNLIKAASLCGGYVCGKYVRDVLIPIRHGLAVDDYFGNVNLRFYDHESQQTFMHNFQGPLVVNSSSITPWDEVEDQMTLFLNEDTQVQIFVTISETALTKDVDVNQLIARIGEDDELVFESTHSELSSSELQKKILSKQVCVPLVAYEEALKNQVVMERLRKCIANYVANGWTVDTSASNAIVEWPEQALVEA